MRAMPLVVFVAEGLFEEGSRAPKTRKECQNEVIELQIASHTSPVEKQRTTGLSFLRSAALR